MGFISGHQSFVKHSRRPTSGSYTTLTITERQSPSITFGASPLEACVTTISMSYLADERDQGAYTYHEQRMDAIAQFASRSTESSLQLQLPYYQTLRRRRLHGLPRMVVGHRLSSVEFSVQSCISKIFDTQVTLPASLGVLPDTFAISAGISRCLNSRGFRKCTYHFSKSSGSSGFM